LAELRRGLCFYLYRYLGIPMAEIALQVGVGTTGVAMAIKEINATLNEMNNVPLTVLTVP